MLSFVADENFDGDIVRAVFSRRPLLDLVRAQDVGLSGADDRALLEWAASQGRIVLTHDAATLIGYAYDRVRRGLPNVGWASWKYDGCNREESRMAVNAAPPEVRETPVTDRHTVPYRIRNHDLKDPSRPVEVLAGPEEIRQLAQDGYLARPNTLSPEQIARLRTAIDEVADAELGATAKVSTGSRFGGLFLRHLADKHQAFLDLLKYQPVLSVVRAVLGPQVQLRGFSARISYPNEPNQETHWHFHQRVVPDPLPPFYSRPQSIEALLYLDDANDASGPLSAVPGSHTWTDRDLMAEQYGELPGQVTLRPTSGTCVFVHGSLWHRAHANTPQGHLRRLLIVGYGPTWMKPSIYGEKPQNGLAAKLLEGADAETKELLGIAGWM